MANLTYIATGQVIDRDTSAGVPGLTVQAFDVDPQRTQILGSTKTDDNGRFKISFDLLQFNYETAPDLFFKLFRNDQLLESTESSVLWNANSQESVTIRISTIPARPPGVDRVTSRQVFKGVDFVEKSDFMGVFNDYRSKAGRSFGMVMDIFTNTFTKMDLTPVRVQGSPQSDVINQDVNVATANLAKNKVEVREVVAYQPGLNMESFKNITALKAIQPGEQVKLYEENGIVRYYSIVPTNNTTPVGAPDSPRKLAKDLADHASQINSLQMELKTSRVETAKKDQMISALQQQVVSLQKSQTDMNTLLKSDKFAKLMETINNSGNTKPEIKKPGTPKGPRKPK